METEARRNNIAKTIKNARAPISATVLAQKFNVSRQIIVGDIALLRAEGADILATPKGYIMGAHDTNEHTYVGTLACQHDLEGMRDELYIIVDHGATAIDVTIEHSIYGQVTGQLDISSRLDVDEFMDKVLAKDAKPLSDLTGGMHNHRIGCQDKIVFDKVVAALKEAGFAH